MAHSAGLAAGGRSNSAGGAFSGRDGIVRGTVQILAPENAE